MKPPDWMTIEPRPRLWCLTHDCWDGDCGVWGQHEVEPRHEVTVALVGMLDAALSAITTAESLDQARGIAHAALNREEYHNGCPHQVWRISSMKGWVRCAACGFERLRVEGNDG